MEIETHLNRDGLSSAGPVASPLLPFIISVSSALGCGRESHIWEFPGSLVVRTPQFDSQEPRLSLVGELRCTRCAANKKKNQCSGLSWQGYNYCW